MSSLVDDRERGRAPELRAGVRLGAYQLLAPIASGGMGRVWAARPLDPARAGSLVAIKTIHPHQANSEEFKRLYLNEATIASRIDHPNVCRVVEVGEERGSVYLVLEWLFGESLDPILHPGGGAPVPLDLRRAVGIIAKVARGLHAAHVAKDENGESLHVVHRDISPQNIMVTQDGQVKLIDFGVALAKTQYAQSKRGDIRGKISYASPEQLAGKAFDHRADIYSLAVVLYELTTGRPPFEGDNEVVLYQAVLRGEMLPPSRIIEDFPGSLEKIIVRGLSEDPAFRIRSGGEFAKLLEAWLDANGGPIRPEEIAALLIERVSDRLEKRKQKILDGGNTLSGFGVGPKPPRAFTPSGPSVSGVLPLGHHPPSYPPPTGLLSPGDSASVGAARSSAPPPGDVLPPARAEAPLEGPSTVAYIIAAAVGVSVVLLLAIVWLLVRR